MKLLEEALRWNAPLKTVVLSEGVDVPVLPSGVRAVRVPADVMRSISPMETPQGALFTVRLPDTKTLTPYQFAQMEVLIAPLRAKLARLQKLQVSSLVDKNAVSQTN
mgnify:CR=1 FL=1